MLRSKDKRYALHVHQDRVVLSRQSQTHTEISAKFQIDDAGLSRAIASCIEQLPQKSARVEIVLDDSYARFWQVNPPLGATRFADLRAAASLRFDALFGLSSNEWMIEAAWDAKKEFWACALPLTLVRTMEQALHSSSRKIKTLGCYPYFIQQWNQHADLFGKKTEGFAVVNEGVMTLALISEASIKSIRTLPIDLRDAQSLQIADKAVHSLSLQLGIEPPQEVLLAGRLHGYRKEYVTGRIRWRQIKPDLPASTRSLSALEAAA